MDEWALGRFGVTVSVLRSVSGAACVWGKAMCVMRAFQTIGGGDEYVAGREMLYFECLRVL